MDAVPSSHKFGDLEPIGNVIARAGAELGRISTLIDDLEDVVANALDITSPLGGSAINKLQNFDQIKQQIDATLTFLNSIASLSHGDWQMDVELALRGVKLGAVAGRLRGNLNHGTTAVEASAAVELFDEKAPFILDRSERRECLISARFMTREGELGGKITNISTGGLGLIVNSAVRFAPTQRIAVDSPETGHLACFVRWGAHPKYGVEFEKATGLSERVKRLYDALPKPPTAR